VLLILASQSLLDAVVGRSLLLYTSANEQQIFSRPDCKHPGTEHLLPELTRADTCLSLCWCHAPCNYV